MVINQLVFAHGIVNFSINGDMSQVANRNAICLSEVSRNLDDYPEIVLYTISIALNDCKIGDTFEVYLPQGVYYCDNSVSGIVSVYYGDEGMESSRITGAILIEYSDDYRFKETGAIYIDEAAGIVRFTITEQLMKACSYTSRFQLRISEDYIGC